VQLAFNDDIVQFKNQNSRIDFRAQQTGNYRIVVTTFNAGAVGQFTLRVTPLGPGKSVAPPPPPPPRFGAGIPAVMPGPGGIPFRPVGNQVTIGDIPITAEPPLMPANRGGIDETHGYVEYRLTIRNDSAEAHRVAVTVPRGRPGGVGGNYLR